MSNKQNIWALQLVRYLIASKNYIQMTVKTNYVDVTNRVEYWLVNTHDADFTIVHITNLSDMERNQTAKTDTAMFDKVLEVVGKKEGKVLDISLAEEASSYYVENIRYINLYPGAAVDEMVAKSFPELSTVIHDLDGDYQKNVRLLEGNIQLASIAAIKNARKAAFKKSLTDRSQFTTSFKVIAGICIVVYLAIVGTAYALNVDSINTAIAFGAYYKAFITILNDYWRLLTAGFVHCSILHLACNLIAYANLSRVAEKYFGALKTNIILLAAIIIGNACVFIADQNTVALGLSGGAYGLLGAILVISIQQNWFASKAYTRDFMQTVILNVFISLLPNVSFMAHLGGLIAGIFLGFILSDDTDKFTKYNFIGCFTVIVVVIGFLMYKNVNFTQFYYGTDQYVAAVYEKIGLKRYAQNILEKCFDYYLKHGG